MDALKKWGKVALCVLSAVMLIVGLAFNAVVIKEGSGWYEVTLTLTGFECFDYAGNGSRAGTIGTFGIISIVVAVAILIYTIYAYMKNKRMCVGIVVGVLFSIVYMIVCFACSTGSTAGFVPAIFQVVFALCYYGVHRVIQKDNPSTARQGANSLLSNIFQPKTAPINQEVEEQKNAISLLKEYKELLDSGIITQEEFDEKKAELLK